MLVIILSICLTFGALMLANKVTNFGAAPQVIAIIAVVSVLLGMIPTYGWLISLITTFLILKSVAKEGVIWMMIMSGVMMLFIVVVIGKVLSL